MTRLRNAVLVALALCAATPAVSQETTVTEAGITIAMADVPVERVAAALSAKTTSTVVARGRTIGQPVTLLIRNATLTQALDSMVSQKPNWLWYYPADKPNTYEIWDQESFRADVLPSQATQKVYVPRHLTAEGFKAISSRLTPRIGSAAFDPKTNKIIVIDLPDVHARIRKLLDEIDYDFPMHVFKVKHANPAFMTEHFAHFKSPAAPSPLFDDRTRQIIVFDRPENVRKMKRILEVLDIETPEPRKAKLDQTRKLKEKQKQKKARQQKRPVPEADQDL